MNEVLRVKNRKNTRLQVAKFVSPRTSPTATSTHFAEMKG